MIPSSHHIIINQTISSKTPSTSITSKQSNIMSSDQTNPSEILQLVLAHLQQAGQQAGSVLNPTYQPNGMSSPHAPGQVAASNDLSLNQLQLLVNLINETRSQNARARNAVRAQENYNLLQSYLRDGNVQNTIATLASSRGLPQDGGTAAALPNVANQAQFPQYQALHQQGILQPSQQQLLQHRVDQVLNKGWQTAQELGDNLLESIKLLSEIDSDKAATAVAVALNMPSSAAPQNQVQPHAQQQQQTHGQAEPQLTAAAQPRPQQKGGFASNKAGKNQLRENKVIYQSQMKDQQERGVPPQASRPTSLNVSPSEDAVKEWSLEQLGEFVIFVNISSYLLHANLTCEILPPLRDSCQRT
jgi:hypothetical protein